MYNVSIKNDDGTITTHFGSYDDLMRSGVDAKLIIDTQCQQICDLIDTIAGEARQRLASPGWGIETEYEHSYKVAVNYLSNNAEKAPIPVQIHAQTNDFSYRKAAEDIVKRYNQANSVLEIIYGLRMNGKIAVKKAAQDTPDVDLMAISQPFIDQLNAVGVG